MGALTIRRLRPGRYELRYAGHPWAYTADRRCNATADEHWVVGRRHDTTAAFATRWAVVPTLADAKLRVAFEATGGATPEGPGREGALSPAGPPPTWAGLRVKTTWRCPAAWHVATVDGTAACCPAGPGVVRLDVGSRRAVGEVFDDERCRKRGCGRQWGRVPARPRTVPAAV